MKSAPSLRIGRAFAFYVTALLLVGIGLAGSAASMAQVSGKSPARSRGAVGPLSDQRMDALPLQRMTEAEKREWIAQTERYQLQAALGKGSGLPEAPPPPPTTPQFIDLTTNPRPPQIAPSTKCRELHPTWSWDQQFIYFSSNNINAGAAYGTGTPSSSSPFHIYRITSDGAFVLQITGVTGSSPAEQSGSQFYPALNHSLTKLAYAHRNSPSEPTQLFILDLSSQQRTQMTGITVANDNFNSALYDVEHPTWAPGDGFIVFAARDRRIANDVRNLYQIDVNSRQVVRRLTNGSPASGVECFDPIYHPTLSVNRVAFAANVLSVVAATGDLDYSAKTGPNRDLDGSGPLRHGPDGTIGPFESEHNLFTMPAGAPPSPAAPVVQLTSDPADDIEPVYNQSLYPVGQGQGSFHAYLAFASSNRSPAAGAPTSARYDVYFSDGLSAESASNRPVLLFTPDTNFGASLKDESQERYPSWSAALPPQNPIDRIVFSSNRNTSILGNSAVIGVSDTDTDLWAAEVTDITAPTLFPIGDENIPGIAPGETLHISNQALPAPGRRVGVAGDTFFFYAKVADLQYGVESVWVQIKDPDGPTSDARGVNHKLYGENTALRTANGLPSIFGQRNVYPVRWLDPPAPTHWLHLPFETDYEGISANDSNFSYFSGGLVTDPAGMFSFSRFASFNPGVDDAARWSGNDPRYVRPVDGAGQERWLQLRDDGVSPDAQANDGVFSASWASPTDPSDYYVDLICYDRAFDPKDPTRRSNWIIYDNIWGFSTQPFVSRNPVLFVDDNGSGQKWPRGLNGNFRLFPTFRYGTESDIIDRPEEFRVTEVRGRPTQDNVPPYGVASYFKVPLTDPDGSTTGITSEAFDFLAGSAQGDFINWRRGLLTTGTTWALSLQAYKYDLWRILAKGPLPEPVLADYLPVEDEQPKDAERSDTLRRVVPRRAVVWSAPYCGDVYLGAGSILDQATQNLLRGYQKAGGRLVVAGGDIAWALTSNGTRRHPFLEEVLGADFVHDEGIGGFNRNFQTFNTGPLALQILQDAADPGFFQSGNGRPNPPSWTTVYGPDVLGTATFTPSQGTNGFFTSGNVDWNAAVDGTPFQVHDYVNPRTGWEAIYQQRMIANAGTVSGGKPSKTVYMSFSLASLGRRYFADPDEAPIFCMNYRAKIAHAMFCWMFSTDLVGQVRNLSGGARISGAFVEVLQGGQVVGTALTRADGTYTIRGIPVGGYAVRASIAGFETFFKADGDGGHGLTQQRLDVFLTPAAPGSISGKVIDKFDGPVAGARIKATLRTNELYVGQREFFTTTLANGTYTFPSVPAGNYDVIVDQPFPPGFTNPVPLFIIPMPPAAPVVVDPAQPGRAIDLNNNPTTSIDFRMEGQPSPLTVTVLEETDAGNVPSEGADVTLLDAAGAAIPGQSAKTDAAGVARFSNVPPGPLQVTAFKRGFQEEAVRISMPQQTTVTVTLRRAVPADLYGLVVREDNSVLTAADLAQEGITVTLIQNTSRVDTGLRASVFAPPVDVPVPHNYKFTAQTQQAQEGRFLLSILPSRRYKVLTPVVVDILRGTNNTAPVLKLVPNDGALSGRVRDRATGGDLSGVRVTVISQATAPGTVLAETTTRGDGTWDTGATKLKPDTVKIEYRLFGYNDNTSEPNVVLAGDTDAGVVFMDRAERGQLYGAVRRADGNLAINPVVLKFFPAPGTPGTPGELARTLSVPPPPPAGPDGGPASYTIGSTDQAGELMPAGTYELRVEGDVHFANYSAAVQVRGGEATRFDVVLAPLAGPLSGFVKELVGGVPGNGVGGARVEIRRDSTLVTTLFTRSDGFYETASNLPPALYTVSATAFGFSTVGNTITVFVEGATQAPDILLERLPPSSVSGLISSSADGSPVADATVELTLIGSNPPVVFATRTSGTAAGDPPANFRLDVAPGQYAVRASKPGWREATTTLTVSPGINITNLNLVLRPDHTFGEGLQLISLPEDYPGRDAASLFGKSPSTFRSAFWVSAANSYAIYPAPDAREFRLGKGMFVRFDAPTAFADPGLATPNVPFFKPLGSGWNMIGSVRRTRIEWLSVRVLTPDGASRTMQQAYNEGIIGNGLFTFQGRYFRSDFMEPFAGYFVRAFRECTLVIPVNSAGASVTTTERARVARMPVSSLARVAAELSAAGLGPATTAPGRGFRPAASRSGLPARTGAPKASKELALPPRRALG